MVFKEIQEAGGTQDRVQLASGIIPAVDGCEIRPHYFEIMVKTIVCWYLQGIIISEGVS